MMRWRDRLRAITQENRTGKSPRMTLPEHPGYIAPVFYIILVT